MKKSMRKLQQVVALTLAAVAMVMTLGAARAAVDDSWPWLPGKRVPREMWIFGRLDYGQMWVFGRLDYGQMWVFKGNAAGRGN